MATRRRQRARDTRARRGPAGLLDLQQPRMGVPVRLEVPLDLHPLLVWAARCYELPLEEYVIDLIQA
jgi:hypothetical protein